MAASVGAGQDANKQFLEAWAQSCFRLQRKQLDENMERIHQFLNQQHSAMQDAMGCSFEKQMQQVQRFLEQPRSLDGIVIDFEGSAPDLQEDDVDEESDETASGSKEKLCIAEGQLAQVRKSLLSSVRGAVGWHPKAPKPTLVPADSVQAFFMRVCHNSTFEFASTFVVVTNTLMIAIDADHSIKSAMKTGTHNPIISKSINSLFLAVFFLELVCRIMAGRCEFFRGDDRFWHGFDVLVVVAASAELLFETVNLSFIRILRVFRMIRIFRIIRVFKKLRELRVMFSAIVASFLTLVWAFVLLALVIFLFCTILIQGAAYYIEDHDFVSAKMRNLLESDFYSLSGGMCTLLAIISNGKEWSNMAELFSEISEIYFYIFLFYVVFTMFGVLNVLTAVFVESSAKISSIDNDLVIQTEMANNESFLNQIEALFLELDDNNSGSVEWAGFQEHLKDPRVLAYFGNLEIEANEAKSLFQLLDTDEDGSVAIEEFVLGCMRLKGMARAIDTAMLMYETKKHAVVNKYNLDNLKKSLDQIQQQVRWNHAAIHVNMRRIDENTRHFRQHREDAKARKNNFPDLIQQLKSNTYKLPLSL